MPSNRRKSTTKRELPLTFAGATHSAAEYLKAALEDSDEPQVLLIVLRHLAEAKGGVAKIAKAAGVKRESLYRALPAGGNPRLSYHYSTMHVATALQ